MNLGSKIKYLRLRNANTQEQLAAYLNVTAQAVSKWENNSTSPDISLLPDISVFFGVTIDELFEMTDQKHFERIETMMLNSNELKPEEFRYALDFLEAKLAKKDNMDESLTLISSLYNHKADEYRRLAEYYAKESLIINPCKKDNHTNLREAQQGTIADWDYGNHSKRIDYYYEFIEKNPEYARGYLWLLDELIEDHRLKEAYEILEKLKKVDHSCRVPYSYGMILWTEGKQQEAIKVWTGMAQEYSKDWLSQFEAGDAMVRVGRYEDAIHYYKKAYELQESPKYTDAACSIAQIYEIQREYEKAIESWEQVIKVLRDEWKITEGEAVEEPLREIERLKKCIQKIEG